MFILGLQGSPRRKGNSDHLLSTFMAEAVKMGARTEIIDVCRRDIKPCLELVVCEKKGFCPIKDDMQREIYGLIRQADAIILASPVFFYGVTAQLKALIDRCQTLWARKYKLRLADPKSGQRRGFFLSVGATRGKELFTGLELTAKYFFDAVNAAYQGSLTYPGVEGPKDLMKDQGMPGQVKTAVKELLKPFVKRTKILFTCQKSDLLSPLAAVMMQFKAGDIFDVKYAGSTPADAINPMVEKVMGEKGIDAAFLVPYGLDAAIENWHPDIFVAMDCWEACPFQTGMKRLKWDFTAFKDNSLDALRLLRNQIEKRVNSLLEDFHQS